VVQQRQTKVYDGDADAFDGGSAEGCARDTDRLGNFDSG